VVAKSRKLAAKSNSKLRTKANPRGIAKAALDSNAGLEPVLSVSLIVSEKVFFRQGGDFALK
jgi:hypothetical protein